jgi:hypothetical protein
MFLTVESNDITRDKYYYTKYITKILRPWKFYVFAEMKMRIHFFQDVRLRAWRLGWHIRRNFFEEFRT